ncbi:alpha/beta hydrolase [Pseudorhodoferax aquiterrae]|uniref:Alpha/beta hydrolase n=1 Tax=Pseudorhodoferax aquiterrae TaxID=747304 RepID=A0ABQ3GDI6_9BURK|nr:alpha/beta fold hydrolase [Pseudorhodoferax aquiterrae]GHD01184.1 alpha/beta hydrolase [Pseudorhodoferax aquiterrae]
MTTTRHNSIHIPVGDRSIAGTLVGPNSLMPGVMLVHGWDGSQEQYIARAHEIAALGCICLTFDLRGHAQDRAARDAVTREDNLADMLAAYDVLVGHPSVDGSAVAVVGSSYGGYLAAILSTLRPVRWLGLRVPALYKDEDWLVPKRALSREELVAYRNSVVAPASNRALSAAAQFEGDVLLVESEFDTMVPHPVIKNYLDAFQKAHSMTYRVIKGADHALSQKAWSQSYTNVLVNWVCEMVKGAKEEAEAARSRKAAAREKSGAPKVLHSASGKVLASGADSPAIA